MSVKTLVSVEEYLRSSYDPDVDYIDGELEDRCVGEKDHAKLQFKMAKVLDSFGWFVAIETRIQVAPNRYRVPDICVYEREPAEQIFTAPPFLVVEVLSPEDRMTRMLRKLEDYSHMGTANIWILDPWRKKAFRYDGISTIEVQDTLIAGEFRLDVSSIFNNS